MDDILESFAKDLRSGSEFTQYRSRMRQRDTLERQIKAIQMALTSYWSDPYKEYGIIEGFKDIDDTLADILSKKGFTVGKCTIDTEWAIIWAS
jgi:hypothetical protein